MLYYNTREKSPHFSVKIMEMFCFKTVPSEGPGVGSRTEPARVLGQLQSSQHLPSPPELEGCSWHGATANRRDRLIPPGATRNT